MEEKLLDSEQAAAQMGLTLTALHVWLHRNPEFRPRQSFGGSYLWSKEDVQRVVEKRQRRKVKA